MSDIYKVNSDKIVGGPGRLVVKEYDGTFPDSISDVMNLSAPHDLVNGWRDLGSTNDGITTSRSFEEEEFEVDQQIGAVDSDITSWEHTLSTNLAENTIENRQLSMIGGTIIETAPVLGTTTILTGAVVSGATIINVTSATGISKGQFIEISEGSFIENHKVAKIQGNTIYLESPLQAPYSTTAVVAPVTQLGTKRIGFGTPGVVPYKTYALISKKKDGSLYMCAIRRAKVSGDAKEQVYGKEKRLIPLNLTAYPVDGEVAEENVYYEIEQVLAP
ncbi:hypothetical protein [Peribacillus frigoritolerans]|uniref:hypothetical protein n=1 Tax=Peribacillus frigoritolerans TaxID=450367 RepID=UPI00207AFD99|nr:hypothetical protein [Peribacillus frigoritolerans]USK77835.1 hypothetical protein LIT31_26275 [Peribacillus frigoritolerans]